MILKLPTNIVYRKGLQQQTKGIAWSELPRGELFTNKPPGPGAKLQGIKFPFPHWKWLSLPFPQNEHSQFKAPVKGLPF